MSRPEAIVSVLLRSIKDKYAPADKGLRISLVGNIAILDVVSIDEHEAETKVASIDLDASALLDVVWVMARDAERSARQDPL